MILYITKEVNNNTTYDRNINLFHDFGITISARLEAKPSKF
jgi:hypothetical protein